MKGQSDVTELRALVPPEFNRECVKCGFPKRVLPWLYVDSDSHWGSICDQCATPILASSLRRKLPSPFLENQFVDAVCSFGVNKKEAELLLGDFEKKGSILRTRTGLFWRDSCLNVSGDKNGSVVQPSPVEPISMKTQRPKRRYRKLTAEEIFLRCVRLSKEILKGENSR